MDSDADAGDAGGDSEGASGYLPAEGFKRGESSAKLPRARSMDKLFLGLVAFATVLFLFFIFFVQL